MSPLLEKLPPYGATLRSFVPTWGGEGEEEGRRGGEGRRRGEEGEEGEESGVQPQTEMIPGIFTPEAYQLPPPSPTYSLDFLPTTHNYGSPVSGLLRDWTVLKLKRTEQELIIVLLDSMSQHSPESTGLYSPPAAVSGPGSR